MSENDIIAEYVKAKWPEMLGSIDFLAYKVQVRWQEAISPAVEALKKLATTITKTGELYPYWNMLTDEQKQIVESITMKIPFSCEFVAKIFVCHGFDMQRTIAYIPSEYGYTVD